MMRVRLHLDDAHSVAWLVVLAAVTLVGIAWIIAQYRMTTESFRCACRIRGRCPDSAAVRQGGPSACNLHRNYQACRKNASRGFATVVLNSGVLVRRRMPNASRAALHRRCRNPPSYSLSAGFACPDGRAPQPRRPAPSPSPPSTDAEKHELCPASRT